MRQANDNGGEGDERGGFQNLAAQHDQFLARTAEQKHAEQFAIAAR